MTATLELVWVSLRAVLQAFTVVGVGAWMSHWGFFGKETLTNLGRLTYYIFIPALSFYKICTGVRLEQLIDAWPFVIYPTLLAGIGFVVGWLLNTILRVEPRALRHCIVVVLMFGNYGNLPFSLFDTITRDVPPFSKDPLALQRAMAFGSIFLSTASLWLWTFSPWYIKKSKEAPLAIVSTEDETEEESRNQQRIHPDPPVSKDATTKAIAIVAGSNVTLSNTSNSDDLGLHIASEDDQSAVEMDDFNHGMINGHANGNGIGIMNSTSNNNNPEVLDLSRSTPTGERMAKSVRVRCKECFSRSLGRIRNSGIWNIMTPSSIACIVAIILLAITPVHHLFFYPLPAPVGFNPTSPVAPNATTLSTTITNAPGEEFISDGDSTCTEVIPDSNSTAKPPLQFFADAISILANVAVPISLLMLGSNIYTTIREQIIRSRLQRSAAPGEAPKSILPLPIGVLIGAVVGKLVVLPVINFCVTFALFKLGLLPVDPLVSLALGIYGCMPSAINLIVLAQLQGDSVVTEQLATILIVEYVFCTISIFITVTLSIHFFVGTT